MGQRLRASALFLFLAAPPSRIGLQGHEFGGGGPAEVNDAVINKKLLGCQKKQKVANDDKFSPFEGDDSFTVIAQKLIYGAQKRIPQEDPQRGS